MSKVSISHLSALPHPRPCLYLIFHKLSVSPLQSFPKVLRQTHPLPRYELQFFLAVLSDSTFARLYLDSSSQRTDQSWVCFFWRELGILFICLFVFQRLLLSQMCKCYVCHYLSWLVLQDLQGSIQVLLVANVSNPDLLTRTR